MIVVYINIQLTGSFWVMSGSENEASSVYEERISCKMMKFIIVHDGSPAVVLSISSYD